MSYKGKFRPTNRNKYRGDINNIVYRSLWERKFMVYCDDNNDIVEWGSEELIIPYVSPLDHKRHRYFPDFYIKTKNGDKFMVEIKPKSLPDHPNQLNVSLRHLCTKQLNGQEIVQNGQPLKRYVNSMDGNF